MKQEEAHQKQEKVFKILFLAMVMALGFVFYNAFFSESSAAGQNTAALSNKPLEESVAPMCVLNKEQKKTVDSMVPALCCRNRKN